MPTKKKIGNQTPTRSLILNSRKSHYKEAIEFYEKSGRKARKWQINLMKAILSINTKKLWTHTKFGFSLPRRNGKNEILVMREFYGLMKGERILHSAHRVPTSHSAWERLCTVLDKAGIEYDSYKAAGKEMVSIPDGGRVEFRTRSSKGGLGEGFDLLVIDEAQEYTDDQESALKYTVTDSMNPQTLMCGTPPTVYSSGTVFLNLRKSALFGETENTGWAEWAVEEMTDMRNVDAWYLTNPSLGLQFTERSIRDEIGSDEIDFNIQRLGLWLKYNQKSAISENDWNDLKIDTLPKLVGKLFVGIKFGADGVNTAMSIAVKTDDNKIFIESIDCQSKRNGNHWIINFLKEIDPQEIVIDGVNGQSILAAEMKDFKLKKPLLPTVKEVVIANSNWEQGIYDRTICHMGQPSLHQVVTNCEKRLIGTSGGFGYKSQYDDRDISLMDSALLAYWACNNAKPQAKQKVWV